MDMTPLLLLICAGGFCTVRLSRLRQFTLSETKVNSTEAQTNCQKNSSDPVTVYNQEDYEQLIQLMTSDNIDRAWIGLHRTQPSLVWSNGDPVNDTAWSPPNYTNPNCVAINPNVTWEICFQEKNFMCYKKGVRDPTLRYTLVTEMKTWYDAQSYCRENYTDLVSITNEGEKEEVKNKGMNSTTPYWIGLLYDDWEWGDGGRSAYRNWLKLKLSSDIYYYPEAGEAVPVLTPNGMLTVPPENEDTYTFCSKESFHLINETKTWEQALDYCNKNYHGLLRLESEADHKIVEQKLSRSVKPVPGPVWVGLRQSRLFGFWLWTNGMPVRWSNWEGYRQPEQPLSNHCGAMATKKGDFKWSDQDCMSTRYFICEG